MRIAANRIAAACLLLLLFFFFCTGGLVGWIPKLAQKIGRHADPALRRHVYRAAADGAGPKSSLGHLRILASLRPLRLRLVRRFRVLLRSRSRVRGGVTLSFLPFGPYFRFGGAVWVGAVVVGAVVVCGGAEWVRALARACASAFLALACFWNARSAALVAASHRSPRRNR